MPFSHADRHAIAARAATIYERHAASASDVKASDADIDSPLLRQWNQAFAPNDVPAFVKRLSWDGLSVSSVRSAASSSMEDPYSGQDPWTVWLDRVASEVPGVRSDLDLGRFRHDNSDNAGPFEELQATARRAGRRALEGRLPPLVRAAASLDVLDAFEYQLAREVGRYADAALYEYFRASGLGYREFVASMLDDGLVRFFTEYASLARQVATVLESWTGATEEFFLRLTADRPAIVSAFASGADPGPVTSVVTGLSDPHHGRRRVCALTFASGLRLVYKPRSVGIERAFSDLLTWLNGGLDHPMRRLVVLDRDTHGWVEFASHEPVADKDEAARWFHQAGALMCLTSVLGARDLHRENLIATSRGPVLIDLELLLQPSGSPSVATADAPAPQGNEVAPPVSCLTTGMLSLIDLTSDGEPHDAGGLRGESTGALPFPARIWRARLTDALHFVDQSTFAAAGTHQVVVDGVAQDPGDYADSLADGFAQAYAHLLRHRDRLLDPSGPLGAFAACFVRVLPRPTNQYAMLAHVLATPKYQRDGATASCAADILHRGFSSAPVRPKLWPMAIEERRALQALDIPYFAVRADGTDAFSGGQLVIAGYFTRSGLDAARARVRALAPSDLDAQVALLRRALSESVHSRYIEVVGSATATRTSPGDIFIDTAEWVAQTLLARADRTDQGLVWSYRPRVGGPGWRDHHLYDGSLGAAVLFSALALVTGKTQWGDAASDALAPLRTHAERFPLSELPADEPVGGGNGLGSVAYGLTLVAALAGDRSWLHLARALAVAVPARLTPDGPVDVVNGSAGALLALLALHDQTNDPEVLDAARACGRHLLDRQTTAGPGESAWQDRDGAQFLGFAHGAAGAAAALARLWAATGDHVFARGARRAFHFVRRHHLQVHGNWPIAVAGDGAAAGGMMTGWCHGAPGITLSALMASRVRPSPAILHGIESALRGMVQWQPSQADHLCCGVLGRVEVLLMAGAGLGREDALEAARVLAARVIDRARARGHFRLSGAGTDYRVFDPGFFQGLSGIGYQLLRVARPSELPSVAGFDTPRASLRYCSPVAGAARSSMPADTTSTECIS